jgi:cyclohexyl-isocyanide hydratase
MNRREFTRRMAAATALGAVAPLLEAGAQEPAKPPAQTHETGMRRMIEALGGDAAGQERIYPKTPRHIAMVIYPGMFPLDMVGPHSVLSGLMNTTVHIVAKDRNPVRANGLTFVPTATLAECPDGLDVLFVPGGGDGTVAMMKDAAMLEFLRHHGASAKWVTSVCTGSLVLGAAGLLKGYRATTHWVTHDILRSLGATPVSARVVEDRNRMTAAGVSAGIDFGLTLAARLTTDGYSKALQLNIEYDPSPPFRAGSPGGAGQTITGLMREMYQPLVAAAQAAAKTA